MGFAVVHMMKIGKGGVRGIQSHNQREKEPKKNPDVDMTRSKQNYDVLNPNNINYNREVKERIQNFAINTKTVRKDAVVMCNFVVTSDEKTMKAMSPAEQRSFFEDSTKFFMKRYGAENVVNATVHMDETTPHMHLGIVPITNDGRLSAKTIFTRKELMALQTDFVIAVGERYGLERGKEGSQRTHLSEERFKLETTKAKIKTAKNEMVEVQEEAKALKENYVIVSEKIKKKYESLEKTSESLSKVEEHTHAVLAKLDKVEAKKAMFGNKLTISEQDYSILVNLAKLGEAKAIENIKLKSKIGDLQSKLKVADVKEVEFQRLKGIDLKYYELERKYKNLSINFDRVEKALNTLNLAEPVRTELKSMRMVGKTTEKFYDMER